MMITLTKNRGVILGFLAVVFLFVPSAIAQTYGPSWEEHCSGNTCTRTLYSGPIAYHNGSEYIPINTTLVPYNQDGYDYTMNEADYTLYIKENSNWGDGIKYCVDSAGSIKCLTYQSQDYSYRDVYGSQDYISPINNVQGTVEGNMMAYENCYNDVDLEFYALNGMLKENYIIKNLTRAPAAYLTEPVTLDFGGYIKFGSLDLYVDDMEMTGNSFTTNRSIEFRDGNDILFYLPEPYAYDAANNQTSIEYEVKVQGQSIWFYVRTPYEWLENATYPVVVDPTVQLQTPNTENLEDTTIMEDIPDTSYGSTDIMYINNSAPQQRHGLLMFNISSLPSSPATSTIHNAILYLYKESSISGATLNISVYEFDNRSWSESTITWNNHNSSNTGSWLDSYIISSSTKGTIYFNVTSWIASKHNAADSNASFIIKHNSSILATISTKERTAYPARYPYLNITYTPAAPEINSNYTTPTTPSYDDTVWITANVSDGDTVVSVNFTVEYPNGTLMLDNENGTQYDTYMWNSSSFITDVEGEYNLTIYATENNGYTTSSTWNFSVYGLTGVPDITNTSWSAAFASDSTQSIYFQINNTGDGNLTNCNMSLSSTIGSASFDQTSFTVEASTPIQVKATFSSGAQGTDGSASITLNCTTNVSGNYNTDTVSGSISVSAPAGSTGGGGGGGGTDIALPILCGSYTAIPTGAFEGYNNPGEPISPFQLDIRNGNITQTYNLELSDELDSYCEIDIPTSKNIPVNGLATFTVRCVAPEDKVVGHIYLTTDTGCEDSRPIVIYNVAGIWGEAANNLFALVTGKPFGEGSEIDWTVFYIFIASMAVISVASVAWLLRRG